MDLTKPAAQKRAYPWAAVLLAHAFLGYIAAAALQHSIGAWEAVSAVFFLYAVGWEGAVQRYGAGFLDAAIDTAAVTAGALLSWAALYAFVWGNLWPFFGVLAMLGVILAGGVWKRRDAD